MRPSSVANALAFIILIVCLSGCQRDDASESAANASRTNPDSTSASATPTNSNSRPAIVSVETAETAPISEDENKRHKLFQAAAITNDRDLIREVARRLGLFNADNTPTEEYRRFTDRHLVWAQQNADFVREIGTPEKARAYVKRQK